MKSVSLYAFSGSYEIHMHGDNLGICPDNPNEGVLLVASGKMVAVDKVLKSDTQQIQEGFWAWILSGIAAAAVGVA